MFSFPLEIEFDDPDHCSSILETPSLELCIEWLVLWWIPMYNVHNAKELTISWVSIGNMREPLRCSNVCLRCSAVLALSTFQQWRSQAEPSTQRFSHFMSFLVCFPSQWIHAAKTDCILSNTLFGKKLWPVLANHITCQADYMCRPNVVDRYFLAPT